MSNIMNKYLRAYQKTKGTEVQKVKSILMHYADAWEWENYDMFVADLMDDQTLTADDIVDFLINVYAMEGGNKEFKAAIKAMQVSLQKAKMLTLSPFKAPVNAYEEMSLLGNESLENIELFIPNATGFLSKHQPLSH